MCSSDLDFANAAPSSANAGATIKYLVKVEGVPSGGMLSAGAFVKPDSGADAANGYWLIVDDQLPADGRVSLLLPQNYAGSVTMKVTPLVSVVTPLGGVLNGVGGAQTATVTVSAVADQPVLSGAGALSGQEDLPIALSGYTVASSDSRETTYVDIVDTAHLTAPAFAVKVGGTARASMTENGTTFFRIGSSELASATLQATTANFKGSLDLGIRGVSQDGSSFAYTPYKTVVATVSAVADAPTTPGTLSLASTVTHSGNQLLEGDVLTLNGLSVSAVDAGETVYFDLFVKQVGGASPLANFSGGIRQLVSSETGYDQYRIEAISSTTAGITRWTPAQAVKLSMKPYLDGTLEVKASATSTEPSNGDAKSISFSPLLVDIRPVSDAPVATAGQDAGFSAFVVENNDYSRLAGGADSTWFSAAVASPDPDEKTAFVIDAGGWASGLAIVVADAAHNATARYVLGASGKSWNKIDLATNVDRKSTRLNSSH